MSIQLYRLKVSLIVPHHPITKLHRILEVSGNILMTDLHELIFEAFDRYDAHAYQFFISHEKMDSFRKLFDHCKEIAILSELMEDSDYLLEQGISLYPTEATRLDDFDFQEKEYLYYWFDFGDDWLHRIRIEKIARSDEVLAENEFIADIISKVGDSPAQYEDMDEEAWDREILGMEDEEDTPNDSTPSDISPELDHELTLMAALMMVAVGEPPVRWQDLVESGVADELVARGLIKPCVSPTHPVRLTLEGESEIVRFMEMTGMGRA